MSSVSARNASRPSSSPLDSFKFDVIGKDPELLIRMKTASAPDVDSRYPSPEPFEQARTDITHLARPTLFQRLAPLDQTISVALTESAEPILDDALLAHTTSQTHSASQFVPSHHQNTAISEPTSRISYEDHPHGQELTAIKSEHTAPDASVSDIRIADRSHILDGTMPQIPPPVMPGQIDFDIQHASATSHPSAIRGVSISSSSAFSAPADNPTSSSNSFDLLHQSLRRRQDGLPIIQGRYDERAAALNASVAQTLESFQTADDQISVVQGEVAAIKARSFEMSQRAQLVISQAEQLFQEALTTQNQVDAVTISATKMADDVRRAKAEFTSAMEKSTRISRYVQKIIDWSAGLSNNEGPLIEDLRAQLDRHEEISTRLTELEQSQQEALRQRIEDEAAAKAEERQRIAIAEEKRQAEAKAAAAEEQRVAEEQRIAEEKRRAKQASLERAEMERREAEAQLDRGRKEQEERQRQKDYRARLEAVQAKQRQIRDDDAARLRAERQGGRDGQEQDPKSKLESKKVLATKLTSEEHGSQHTEESSARPSSGQFISNAPPSDHSAPQPPATPPLSHVLPQPLATTLATLPTLVAAPLPHISVPGQATTQTSSRTTLGNGFVPAQTEAGRLVDVHGPYGSTTLRSEQQVLKSQKAPRGSGNPHSVTIKSSGDASVQPAEKTQSVTSVPSQGESDSTYQPFQQIKTKTISIIKQEPSSDPVLTHRRPSPSTQVSQSSVVQQDLSSAPWPATSNALPRAEELSDSFSRQAVTYNRENRQGSPVNTTSTLPARPVVPPTDASPSPIERRVHQNAPPVPRTLVARDDRVVGDGGWGGFQTNNDSTAGQTYLPPVAPLSPSSDDAHLSSASRNRSRPDDRNTGRRTSDSRSPPMARPPPARHSPVQEARNQARWRADHYSPLRSPPPPSNPRKRSRPPHPEDDDFEPQSRNRSRVPSQYDRRPMYDDRDSRFVTRPDPRRYQWASPSSPRQVMENNYRPAQDRLEERRFPENHEPTRHEAYTQPHDAHRSPEYRGQRGLPLDSRLGLVPPSPTLAEPGPEYFNPMPASSELSGSLLDRIGDTPEPLDAQSASYDYPHSRRGNQGRRLPTSRGRGGRVARDRILGSQMTPQDKRSFAARLPGSLHDRIQ